jgi:hypothetical protein
MFSFPRNACSFRICCGGATGYVSRRPVRGGAQGVCRSCTLSAALVAILRKTVNYVVHLNPSAPHRALVPPVAPRCRLCRLGPIGISSVGPSHSPRTIAIGKDHTAAGMLSFHIRYIAYPRSFESSVFVPISSDPMPHRCVRVFIGRTT